MSINLKRREFMNLLGGIVSSAALMPIAASGKEAFNPDVELVLKAHQGQVALFAGDKTEIYRYSGQVIKGGAGVLSEIPNSYLGPILHLQSGQKVRVRFRNELPEESIIHWHGLIMPEAMDGHPRFAIAPGKEFVYEFTVANKAGTYWFHPHPHGRTAQQVMLGMAGVLIITDKEEQALALPTGEYDLPVVIQDRSFSNNNQLLYIGDGMMGMMERMMGFLGDRIMVNGKADAHIELANTVYRLRLLNGSNSRIYKLAWANSMPMTVIGSDGGLLPKPETRQYIMLAPGERVDLWVDLSTQKVGDELTLEHVGLESTAVSGGMMGNRTRTDLPLHETFSVLNVKITKSSTHRTGLPMRLAPTARYQEKDAVKHRVFNLTMQHMRPGINYRSFEMMAVADDEKVKANSLELWEFRNDEGFGMTMPHPMHIHGVQFQVLQRSVGRGFEDIVDETREGYVDSGWKDTILLMPGERVKVLVKFDKHKGMYLYHCHNLEHSALGMMRNYLVV